MKEKVLEIAKSYVGYLEKSSDADLDDFKANAESNNYTKFARNFFPELQGLAWCCMFVYSCFAYAYGADTATKMLGGIKTARCLELWNAMVEKGLNRDDISKAEEGDLIFFQKNGFICHIGIVIKVNKDSVETIEGNTFLKNNELVESGDGVYQKKYEITNEKISGVASPDWKYVCK